MQNWQAGYSYPAQQYQYTNYYTTHSPQSYASVNYGVQTPYYEYGPVNCWDPYEASVYPDHYNSAASDMLEDEHVTNLFRELDQLKDEVRRLQEAKAAHLAKLAQELEDLKNEVRECEELEAREEANAITWQKEKVVEPQTLPPPYIPKLPFPQRAMLTPTTLDSSKIAEGRQGEVVDESFAETLKEGEIEKSAEEEECDLLHFHPRTSDDSSTTDLSVEDGLDIKENECAGKQLIVLSCVLSLGKIG